MPNKISETCQVVTQWSPERGIEARCDQPTTHVQPSGDGKTFMAFCADHAAQHWQTVRPVGEFR